MEKEEIKKEVLKMIDRLDEEEMKKLHALLLGAEMVKEIKSGAEEEIKN